MISSLVSKFGEIKTALKSAVVASSWIMIACLIVLCIFVSWLFEHSEPIYYRSSQVILIGISTSLFTRLLGGMGVFRDAISDVLGGDKWLDRRNDLEDLWRRITRRIFLPNFKASHRESQDFLEELNEAMNSAIQRPKREANYYIKNMKRRIDVSWKNADTGLVHIYDFLICDIVPFDERLGCRYDIAITPTAGVSVNAYNADITDFEVDDLAIDPAQIQVQPNKKAKVYYIILKGKSAYKVSRIINYEQYIGIDPVYLVANSRVIWGMNAIINVMNKDLRVIFEEVGVEGRFRRENERNGRDSIEYDTRNVLLPDQGFMLILARGAPAEVSSQAGDPRTDAP